MERIWNHRRINTIFCKAAAPWWRLRKPCRLPLVLSPRLHSSTAWTLTLDYFDINVEKGIGSIPAATALEKCLDTGISTFCNLINRNPVNGSLWLTGGYISAQTTNLSEENVEGIDVIFDAETYWDLTAKWSATGNYIVTGGISNLLDTDPQVRSDAGTAPGNGNTFPAFFDALGRYVFVNLGVSF